RQAQVARTYHGYSVLFRCARDCRRFALHRQGNRRIHRARHRHRENSVAIPDQLRHQRAADHVHAQGPAVCRDSIRVGRRQRPAHGRAAEERAARRIGLGLCLDGLSDPGGALYFVREGKTMKMMNFACVLAPLLIAGCSTVGPTQSDLVRDGANTDNVLTYGMGYSQNRYSPLAQINKSNVKRMVPVWSLGLENNFGEQAQPLMLDGVMYVSNAKWTVAIDASTGKQLWRTAVDFPPDTPRVVCCGVS